VNMVVHQTKSVNSMFIPRNACLKEQQETTMIGSRKENIIPAIASHHYMIIATGEVDSGFACHKQTIYPNTQLSSLTQLIGLMFQDSFIFLRLYGYYIAHNDPNEGRERSERPSRFEWLDDYQLMYCADSFLKSLFKTHFPVPSILSIK